MPKSKQPKLTQEELFPHGKDFGYRLQLDEVIAGLGTIAWFQSESHLTKHVERYRITKGKIDVRTHELEEARKKNVSIRVTCGDKDGVMIIPPEMFDKPTSVSKETYPSKVKGLPDFKLHSFYWKADTGQIDMF